MANDMFEKFNTMFDLDGLKEDIEKSSTEFEFEEVPYGMYEVSIGGLEMGLTSERAKNPNKPILKVRFKILNGDHKGRFLFYNQALTSGFGIKVCNDFLRSLETSIVVEFKDFVSYADLIDSIKQELENDRAEFAIKYYDKKGWDCYDITQRFQ